MPKNLRVAILTDLSRYPPSVYDHVSCRLEQLSYKHDISFFKFPTIVDMEEGALKSFDVAILRPTDRWCPSPANFEGREEGAGPVRLLTISTGKDHLSKREFESEQHKSNFEIYNPSEGLNNARGVAAFNVMAARVLLSRLTMNCHQVDEGLFENITEQTSLSEKVWLALGAGDQAAWLLYHLLFSGVKTLVIWKDKMDINVFQECFIHIKSLECNLPAGSFIISEVSHPLEGEWLAKIQFGGSKETPEKANKVITIIGTSDKSKYTKYADVISVHVPAVEDTPDREGTINLINEDFLGQIKQGAMLINTSRGATVNEAAILRCLENKKLGGAFLDVLSSDAENQSDISKSEAWMRRREDQIFPKGQEILNLIISPHISGLVDTDLIPMWDDVLNQIEGFSRN